MRQKLRDVGLTGSEIEVYLSLLQTGPSSTGGIMKSTRLQSSTVYHALEFLLQKGLASYVLKNKRKEYKASDPSQLLKLLDEKKESMREQEESLNKIIPSLMKIQKQPVDNTEASVYEGYKGIKTAFDDIIKTLKKGDEYYVFGARGGLPLKWTSIFFMQFNKERVRKGIRKMIIFNEDVRDSAGKGEERLRLTRVRYLPQMTPSAINIYGDKVLIAQWTEKPVAFVIRNKETADSYRAYFRTLWRTAEASHNS